MILKTLLHQLVIVKIIPDAVPFLDATGLIMAKVIVVPIICNIVNNNNLTKVKFLTKLAQFRVVIVPTMLKVIARNTTLKRPKLLIDDKLLCI